MANRCMNPLCTAKGESCFRSVSRPSLSNKGETLNPKNCFAPPGVVNQNSLRRNGRRSLRGSTLCIFLLRLPTGQKVAVPQNSSFERIGKSSDEFEQREIHGYASDNDRIFDVVGSPTLPVGVWG